MLRLVAMPAVLLWTLACTGCPPKQNKSDTEIAPYQDSFERTDLGDRFIKQGGTWAISDGALRTTGEKNIPLWLNVPLSRNTRVEFTTISRSSAVDTKIEIFGDGLRHESGYIVILGGWNNSITTIARLDEHEETRVEKRTRWDQNRKYHWKVERTDGRTLALWIDGTKVVEYADSDPLYGARNNILGFTNWQSDISYDDLVITPLPD